MQERKDRYVHRIIPAVLPLVLIGGIAVGSGQYRRVTNDIPNDIDRFERMLAPLRKHNFESLQFSGPMDAREACNGLALPLFPVY